ncbi:MAG: IclR family transcriptional regulator [Oscillospiraceae bacterium]|nr:IclR family transcriptional regulator [Oscillospiraceae bacterium]
MEFQQHTVQSVDKAITLLEILLQNGAPMTLADLSQRSGFPKSTTHALLSTMRRRSMITQRSDGRYYLGLRLFECGCAVAAEWDISRVARPYLENLAAATGASTFLSVIDGSTVMNIEHCAGSDGLHVVSEAGHRLPLHATSQGKLLLSAFSDGEVLRRAGTMPIFTPHTIGNSETLLAAMERIRREGYAVEDGEYRIGLRSVSAPVYDRNGNMAYAIGVVGFFRRVASEEFAAVIAHTREVGRTLSHALGYRE